MRRAVLTLSLLVAAGCGMAEYEEKMKGAQERLKRREIEDRDLGQPADIPTRRADAKSPPAPVARLFIRLPKGLALPQRGRKDPKDPPERLLYTYAPGKAIDASPFIEAGLAFGLLDDKDFAGRVMGVMRAATSERKTFAHPVTVPGRPQVPMIRTTFDSGTAACSLNVYRGKTGQIAIVYVWDKAKQQQAGPIVELSLQTLAVDDDADRALAELSMGGPLGQVPRFR